MRSIEIGNLEEYEHINLLLKRKYKGRTTNVSKGEAINGSKRVMAPASPTVPLIYKRLKYMKIRNSSKLSPHNVIIKNRKYT